MKTRHLFFSLLAGMALGACSSGEENMLVADNEKAYVKVQIAMADGGSSRAVTEGNFENGSEDEHKVTNIEFAFFGPDNKFMTWGNTITNADGLGHQDGAAGDNVESIVDAVVALKLSEESRKPTQVIAYVNMERPNFTETTTIADAYTLISSVAEVGKKTAGCFAMTSSTYVDAGEVVTAATINPTEDFFETAEAAKAHTNPIEIYVERLNAKVVVNAIADNVKNKVTLYENNVEQTIYFYPTAWAINGVNENSYQLKNVDGAWNFVSPANNAWNISQYNRCFWAKDVNYENQNTYPLTFVAEQNTDAWKELGISDYCLENTLTSANYDANEYTACTHVLVKGYYSTQETGATVGEDFYVYAGNKYNDTGIKTILARANNIVFTDAEGKEVADSYDLYGLGNPDGDGDVSTVYLEFVGDYKTKLYYYKKDNGYEQIDNETELAAVNTALKNGATGEGFIGGMAYFEVPVEHFLKMNETDKTGEIGVVRNHFYKITVNSISGLGSGIYKPNEPIIPGGGPKEYYLGAKVNILSWKVVNQNANL